MFHFLPAWRWRQLRGVLPVELPHRAGQGFPRNGGLFRTGLRPAPRLLLVHLLHHGGRYASTLRRIAVQAHIRRQSGAYSALSTARTAPPGNASLPASAADASRTSEA